MKKRSYETKHRIKELIEEGWGTVAIARELRVSRVNVWQIIRRHNLDNGERRMMPEDHVYSINKNYSRKKNDTEAGD